MDRMSPLDSAFLLAEDDHVSHMHVGSISIFEGPAPSAAEFDEFMAGRLPLLPRYRQKVRIPPFNFGRPVWVDDPHFNLGYHLRHTALAGPGGDAELRTLVGRLMSQRLDRGKPLWETWTVEGLEDDRWAMICKTHHCMVDGLAATDLLTVSLDLVPEPVPPVPDDWRPKPEPSTVAVVTDALAAAVLEPMAQIRAMRGEFGTIALARGTLHDFLTGFVSLMGVVRPLHRSSIDGPIGPHRRWDWARSTLADVKQVRQAFGGTVNDVVLAAITSGFRSLLLGRGEVPDGHTVRSLVPVSVRPPGEHNVYNNRVSALFAELPVGIEDPVERLTSIHEQMEHLKHEKGAVTGEVLTELSGFTPPVLLALGARMAFRAPQRNINTVTTNIPGPQMPLYALGRRLLAVFPYVPIQGQVRLGIAIFSYDGELFFGITGDYDTTADISVLARGIEDGMAELLKAAG
jgi:diacylglycerol O-acyltransferase